MADSVKISELPAVAGITGGYILPAVDETLSQTSKVTAAQVAAIGGGPPGDNTVLTQHLTNASVTPVKTGFSSQNRISVSTTSSTQVNGNWTGTELSCTPYVQGLFSAEDGPAARSYLDALQSTDDAVFTGQTRFPDGTNLAPSITNTGNINTGFFFPLQNAVGIAAEGIEVARHTTAGFRSVSSGFNNLLPHYGVRAHAAFNGTIGATFFVTNPHEIGIRAGFTSGNTLRFDTATVQKLADIEASRSLTLVVADRGSLASLLSVGTGFCAERDDTRLNYTSPGDNYHKSWDTGTSTWIDVPASSGNWIGSIALTTTGTASIKRAGNVSSITQGTAGGVAYYRVAFLEAMPTADYTAVISCYDGSYGTVLNKASTYVDVVVRNAAGSVASSQDINVAIIL